MPQNKYMHCEGADRRKERSNIFLFGTMVSTSNTLSHFILRKKKRQLFL